MKAFIDEHRDVYGVEPICKALPTATLTYYAHATRAADPLRRSDRSPRDDALSRKIERSSASGTSVAGSMGCATSGSSSSVRMSTRRAALWRAMMTPGSARSYPRECGAYGGERWQCAVPPDHVRRNFKADRPKQLWLSDFTYVSAWEGFIYFAFVIDVFACRIVDLRVVVTDRLRARPARAGAARPPAGRCQSSRASQRPRQHVPIRYRAPSRCGSRALGLQRADSYDKALAETINGLYKAEVIERRLFWHRMQDVESGRHCSGWTGTTIAGRWGLSVTSRRADAEEA